MEQKKQPSALDRLARMQRMPTVGEGMRWAASKNKTGSCVVRFPDGVEVHGESIQAIMLSCGAIVISMEPTHVDESGRQWYEGTYFGIK